VLEIGCGPGLVATCLCRTGVSRVLLTDGDPQTLVNCLSNLSLNGHTDGTLLGSWRAATDVFARQETRGSSVLQRQVSLHFMGGEVMSPRLRRGKLGPSQPTTVRYLLYCAAVRQLWGNLASKSWLAVQGSTISGSCVLQQQVSIGGC
jgi:hypothetical protein